MVYWYRHIRLQMPGWVYICIRRPATTENVVVANKQNVALLVLPLGVFQLLFNIPLYVYSRVLCKCYRVSDVHGLSWEHC
jgi:hypothetical protein